MSWRAYHNVQGLIFIGWGLFILDKIWSGTILFLINRRYILLILITAVAFVALAQAALSPKRGKDHSDRSELPEEGHHHDPEGVLSTDPKQPPRSSMWGLVIIAFPLLLGTFLPPRPLGSSVIANRGVNSMTPLSNLKQGETTSLSIASTEKSVLDWVGDFNSASDPSKNEGQEADVTGFVYHDPRLGKNKFMVSRFAVTCCVADAVALGMIVDWPNADQFTDNTWVEVNGLVTVDSLGGQSLPGIHARMVKHIDTPDQPYLFP